MSRSCKSRSTRAAQKNKKNSEEFCKPYLVPLVRCSCAACKKFITPVVGSGIDRKYEVGVYLPRKEFKKHLSNPPSSLDLTPEEEERGVCYNAVHEDHIKEVYGENWEIKYTSPYITYHINDNYVSHTEREVMNNSRIIRENQPSPQYFSRNMYGNADEELFSRYGFRLCRECLHARPPCELQNKICKGGCYSKENSSTGVTRNLGGTKYEKKCK